MFGSTSLLHKNNIVLNSYELCVLCFVLISKPHMQVNCFRFYYQEWVLTEGKKLSLMRFTYLKFALEPGEPNVYQIRFFRQLYWLYKIIYTCINWPITYNCINSIHFSGHVLNFISETLTLGGSLSSV